MYIINSQNIFKPEKKAKVIASLSLLLRHLCIVDQYIVEISDNFKEE